MSMYSTSMKLFNLAVTSNIRKIETLEDSIEDTQDRNGLRGGRRKVRESSSSSTTSDVRSVRPSERTFDVLRCVRVTLLMSSCSHRSELLSFCNRGIPTRVGVS